MNARQQQVLRAAVVGDALGRPFNGLRQGHVRQVLGALPEGHPTTATFFPDRPERNVVPGIHSAGAQRLLAAVALATPDDLARPPAARVGATLMELQEAGALRNPGRPLSRAVERWAAEYPWEEGDYFTGTEASEGIGAALAGIAAACCPAAGEDAAIRLARLTHFRLLSVAAAEAVRFLLSRLIAEPNPAKLRGEHLAAELEAHLREWEPVYTKQHLRTWKDNGWGAPLATLADALSPLASLLREENDTLAEKTIVATAADCHPLHAVTHVQHGFVPAGLAWALYRGLGPLSAVHAIEDIQTRGGESAAIGAIAAALLAARHGPECLPDEYYSGTRILSALDGLLASPTAESTTAWLGAEKTLSAEEAALHEELHRALRRQAERDAAKGKTPPRKKPTASDDEDEPPPFPPPPHLWIKPGDEEDPRNKRILKAARGKRKIDWKEERREKRKGDTP